MSLLTGCLLMVPLVRHKHEMDVAVFYFFIIVGWFVQHVHGPSLGEQRAADRRFASRQRRAFLRSCTGVAGVAGAGTRRWRRVFLVQLGELQAGMDG